jgi:hypothetical protein
VLRRLLNWGHVGAIGVGLNPPEAAYACLSRYVSPGFDVILQRFKNTKAVITNVCCSPTRGMERETGIALQAMQEPATLYLGRQDHSSEPVTVRAWKRGTLNRTAIRLQFITGEEPIGASAVGSLQGTRRTTEGVSDEQVCSGRMRRLSLDDMASLRSV